MLSLQLDSDAGIGSSAHLYDMALTPRRSSKIKGAELPTNPVVSICGQAIRRMVDTGHVHWLGRRTPNRQTVRALRRGRSDLFKGVSSSIYKYRLTLWPSTISKSLHKGTLRSSLSLQHQGKQSSRIGRSILFNEHVPTLKLAVLPCNKTVHRCCQHTC